MFLLDTNVISELRKAGEGRADANVVRWLNGVDAESFYLSVVTLMEVKIGILRLARRDTAQAARLREWLESWILPEFENRTLSIDRWVALRCAQLHVPDPQPERDALIAATALIHGLKLVTRNVGDFAKAGVDVINPWQG